jgi:hypothetical protein
MGLSVFAKTERLSGRSKRDAKATQKQHKDALMGLSVFVTS